MKSLTRILAILAFVVGVAGVARGANDANIYDGNGNRATYGVLNSDGISRRNLWLNSSNELLVAASCSVGGATEDAAETNGMTVQVAGCIVRPTKVGSSSTTNDVATCNVTAAGGMWGASDQLEDAAEASGQPLNMIGVVARTAKAGSSSTDGDQVTLNVAGDGGLYLASDVVEDAAETAGGFLVGVGAVVRSTVVGSTSTNGDNATLNVSTTGALHVIQTGHASLVVERIDVAATGTAVQGATATVKECFVSCPGTNTSACYIRTSAGNGVTGGFAIAKGTTEGPWAVTNTNLFWVDAGTNGDDVVLACSN